MNWVYGLAVAAIVGFCFRKPDFPKRLATKVGVRSDMWMTVFLILYWIAVPVAIHRLMSQIRLE